MEQRIIKTPLERMMTAKEVADFLNINICSLRRWDKKGILKCYHIGERRDMRYLLEDVLLFIEKNGSSSRVRSAQNNVLITEPHNNKMQ